MLSMQRILFCFLAGVTMLVSYQSPAQEGLDVYGKLSFAAPSDTVPQPSVYVTPPARLIADDAGAAANRQGRTIGATKLIAYEQACSVEKSCTAASSERGQENVIALRLALRYQLQPGWHLYWHRPGAAGYAPQLLWDEPSHNRIISEYWHWKLPKRFILSGLEQAGYEGEGEIPITLHLNGADLEQNLHLRGVLNLLVCEKICIPVVQKFAVSADQWRQLKNDDISFDRHMLLQEATSSTDFELPVDFSSSWLEEDGKLWLDLSVYNQSLPSAAAMFIALGSNGYGLEPMRIKEDGDEAQRWRVPLINIDKQEILNLNSVQLTTIDQNNQLIITPLVLTRGKTVALSWSSLLILPLALLAGLILNFMPCVLPVLALKLSQTSQFSASQRGFAVLTITAGFCSAALSLGAIILILRSLGLYVGWGLQFQNPWVLVIFSLIFVLFAIDLAGLRIWPASWPRLNAVFFGISPLAPSNKGKALSTGPRTWRWFTTSYVSFWLATPCGAPILGSVITASLWASNAELLLNFAFIGLGMSSPILLASLFRRGAPTGRAKRFGVPIRKILIIPMLIAAIWFGSIAQKHFFPTFNSAVPKSWQAFSVESFSRHRAEGRRVWVHITADWCLTCKLNSWHVLSTETFISKTDDLDIIRLWGDWTLPDESIRRFLAYHKRYGLPFDAVYQPEQSNGYILPELLTIANVTEALADPKNPLAGSTVD